MSSSKGRFAADLEVENPAAASERLGNFTRRIRAVSRNQIDEKSLKRQGAKESREQ